MSVHSSFARAIASILVVGQLFVGMPLTAAPAAPVAATPASQSSATSPTITPNRTIPEVTSPATTFTLSATPTDAELSSAHAFPEPLVPMSRPTTDAENGALAAALTEYAGVGQSELVAPLTRFLSIFPRSAWRASLLANIGAVYRTNGFYASALNAWRLAWADARDEVNPRAKAVADMALGEWLDLSIQVGHSDEVSGRLAELLGRPLSGRAAQKVASAREQLWLVRNRPEQVHPSGAAALGAVLAYAARVAGNPFVPSDVLRTYRMTATDTTLNELRTLAQRVGLSWNMVLRPRDADIPVPSVMHWRLGHFTAVLKHEGDRYLLVDSILGGARWVSRDMLDQESSGYFLAPPSTLTAAWPQVTQADAATVIGRCPPNTPDDSDPCGPCGSGSSGGPGMATYSLQMMPANLRVTDLPLTYVPTIGPAVSFRLTYNQRESLQPQIFSYGNIGPMWTFDWLSAVIDDPTHPAWSADVVLRGGGAEHYFNMNATGTFPAHWRSRAVLVQVSSNPIRYERRLRDGGVEVFAQSDGTVTAGRRVYLTDIMDPQGQTVHLTYDASLRLVAITDATGLVTTLSYELATDPLKITRVTDPYGRFATLTYNDAGLLKRITDGIGLTSDFTYGPANFLVSLTTPYGTTLFKHETDPSQDFYYRFIQATDPLGGTERAEFHWSTTALPSTAPTAEVPTGFSAYNHDLDLFNTFYWDKRAMATAPGDVSAATITHWLASDWADISLITGNYFVQVYSSAVPHSMKRPLERRVWYTYPGQTTPFDAVGTWMEPTQTARVLDDGTAQIAQATYNDQGNVTSRIDPLGRQTTYDYANNGMDLLQIRQTSNGVNDLLASSSDYTSQHRAQTTTDASGQSTTYTYNSVGQPLTVTNAKNETTTFAYDADHRLRTVTAPMNGAVTTYTYDDYGRMRTVTDADGYTATTDYDAFDRPTRVTYPGGTTQTTTYDRLDVAARTDRIGRTTRYFYDPLRRLVSTRDLLGRIVAQEWCTCGSLSKLIDANGRATSWDRDVQGRVTRELRADGTTATTYTYDATTSRLKTVTDPKGQVTTYTYTLDDAIQQVAYSNSQIATPSVSYTYDPTYARAATMADGTGTTAYAYHPVGELGAGHVASVDGPFSNDTITYAYDELGRVASRAINGVAMTQGYDPLGRVTTEANVLGTFTYAYDGVTNRLAAVTYPNGQTSVYSYFDNAGDRRLQTIHHKYPSGSTLSKFDYTYDAVGNILTWRQQADSSAVIWEYGYDAADQLTAAVKNATDPQATVLKRYAYGYDPAGNRTSEQIDDAATAATFDGLNRLVGRNGGGPVMFKGQLDEPATVTINGTRAVVLADNRFQGTAALAAGTTTVNLTATDPSGNTATAVYEVDQSAAANVLTYDANGNLTFDGTRTFEWDAEDRLTAVTQGVRRSEFSYDGLGRRVAIVEKDGSNVLQTRDFVWADGRIHEERDANNIVIKRFLQRGVQQAGSVLFAVADHLDSTRELTDTGGAIRAAYDYDSWGNRTKISGDLDSDFGFGGYLIHSPSALYFSQSRAMDPSLGRWLSEDPSGIESGANLFAYVEDSPINMVDPSGRVQISWDVHWHFGDPDSQCPTLPDPNTGRRRLSAGACTRNPGGAASGYCEGGCDGLYHAKTRFIVVGEIIVSPTFPYKNRRPLDPNVTGPQSALAHEYYAHILPAVNAAVGVLEALERRAFSSKPLCDQALSRGLRDANRAFRDSIRNNLAF